MLKGKKVGVISLGCDKNRVDTEKMLFNISQNHSLVSDVNDAEVIVINTCAFLESARREAIDEIFSAVGCKKDGNCQKIIVTGCLPQKFIDEIYEGLYEVDGFLGVSDYQNINQVIEDVYLDKRVNAVGSPKLDCQKERVMTTDNYAYLKIADGCSNHCTYCLIPYIRGRFRSTPSDLLLEETKLLGNVNELILVAQDLTRYGKDLTTGEDLVSLIQKLSSLDNVKRIRLLYCYPEGITDSLIEEFKTNDKLIKYIDIPMQHADDKVLKLMNRRGTGKDYLNLVKKLKKEIKGIYVRSTFITGFPGEDQRAFDNLVAFIERAKLFNVGFFAYSREKGTPAYNLPNQVKYIDKQKRLRKLYSVQKRIAKENAMRLIGKKVKVLAEGFDFDKLVYFGRADFNAPSVDGKIYFFSGEEVVNGECYMVRLDSFSDYNFYGERL